MLPLRVMTLFGRIRAERALFGALLIGVIGLSWAFQVSVCPARMADRFLNRVATPDTQTYAQLARDLGHKDADPLSVLLRTPGYPLFIRFAAIWAGVDWSRVTIGVRDWNATSDEGRQLLMAVIGFNRVCGFLIPVLIFLIVCALTGSVWVGALSSFAYIIDIGSVSYECVALSEIPSLFAFTMSNLAAVFAFRRPTPARCLFYGITAGCAMLMRPEHMLLPCIGLPLLAVAVFLQHRAAPLRQLAWVQLKALAPAVLVIGGLLGAYALYNLYVTGHFVYSLGVASTLPNFGARHFVQMDVADDDLKILQQQWREELDGAPSYAGIKGVCKDGNLAALNCDTYGYLRLSMRASMLAIRANWRVFLRGARNHYLAAWREPFADAKSFAAYRRLEASPFRWICRGDGRLLLGRRTLLGFLALSVITFGLLKGAGPRLFLAYIVFVVLIGSILCVAVDEADIFRHMINYRTYANAVCLTGIGLLCGVLVGGARRRLWPAEAKALEADGGSITTSDPS